MEHAVILALIVGTLVAAVGFLGSASADVFARLDGSNSSYAAGQGDSRRIDIAKERTPFNTPGLVGATQARRVALGAVGLIGFAAVVSCLIVKRRMRTSESIRSPEVPPATTADQYLVKRQEILRAFSGDLEGFLTNHVLVRHLMSTRLKTVVPTATVAEMKETMSEQKLRHLLVVDADGRLRGIVSDRDLHVKGNRRAEAIMTRKLRTCAPDTPLRQAVSSLLEWHISSLPVVDDGRPIGIVTLTDVAMGLQCALQVIDRIANELTGDAISAAALISAAGSRALNSSSICDESALVAS